MTHRIVSRAESVVATPKTPPGQAKALPLVMAAGNFSPEFHAVGVGL